MPNSSKLRLGQLQEVRSKQLQAERKQMRWFRALLMGGSNRTSRKPGKSPTIVSLSRFVLRNRLFGPEKAWLQLSAHHRVVIKRGQTPCEQVSIEPLLKQSLLDNLVCVFDPD
jgi:hypothetical protein